VQEGRGSQNLQVRAVNAPQMLRQAEDAADMLAVVGRFDEF
jgi:hypothetical protein